MTDNSPPSPSDGNVSSQSIQSIDRSIGSPQHASSPIKIKPSSNAVKPNQPPALRVMIINLQSIRAKRQPLWLLLEELKPDIVIGNETWLHSGIHEREVIPSGYHIIARKDRDTGQHGGGVIIFAKEGVVGCDLGLKVSTELTAASVECKNKQKLIIVSAYRPPNSDATYMTEMRETITDIHCLHPEATIWLAGDFNLPDIDWGSNCISGNQYNKNISQQLLDLIYDTGSEQMIKFETRGKNTLDLFITNRPSLVIRTKPLPGVSDHDIVFAEVDTKAVHKKLPSRKILLWKKADMDSLKLRVGKFSESFIGSNTANTDINTLWNTFKSNCTTIINDLIPSKMSSSRVSQPWITGQLKRMTRQKKRAYRKAKKSGDEQDITAYKTLQKNVQHQCKKAYNEYINNLVAGNNNPKKLYSFISSKRQDSSGVTLLKRNGIGHCDPSAKATILNNQFSSVFTEENHNNMPDMGERTIPNMVDFSIDCKGVEKLLAELNPHKAQGPDNIPPNFLKCCAKELSPSLTLIFQASLEQGKVPDDWKQALVTPLFKKGDRTAPENYRPISLTSVCCKLMEHIIHSQVMHHLDKHNALCDQQHGFRKRRSCESQLILTLQDLAKGIEEGEQIDAVLLDFSKAFDKVPHQRLLYKINHYGVHGATLRWIESFLSGRTQQVVVEGQSSPSAPVTSGVPQGSVLGPLLFLLYINDMPSRVTSTTRLFADDSLLYCKIKTVEDTRTLQEDLRKLEQWESDWQMQFNPGKCEVIRISRRKNLIQATYQIHQQDLSVVENGRYLGVTLNNKLSWNPHVDSVTKKANNSLAFLRRNLARCPTKIKAQCYQTLVRPILEYASPVWDPHTNSNINKLEAVQRRAARFVTGDYRTTSSTTDMLTRLQWPTLQERRCTAKVIMIYRISYCLVDIPAAAHLHPSGLSTRGHTLRYLVPYCRTDVYRCSFFPTGIRLWNQLPEAIATAPTLESFKARLAAN